MLLLLVTMNNVSTIFAVQNKFVGVLLFVIYWFIFLRIVFDFNGTYSLSLYRHLNHVQGRD